MSWVCRSDPLPDGSLLLHATAVAVAGRALLITGASGSGKSALALEMMARGAQLVADDRVIAAVDPAAGGLWLSAPARLRGLIEARGLGLLHAESLPRARAAAILDLDRHETARLPDSRETELLGCRLPLLHNFASAYFPAGLVQYLKAGRGE